MPPIDVKRDGAVARVWLDRPEQHNALSAEVLAAIAENLHTLAHDPAVRVVVLGGRGPSFCAGADLNAMKAAAHATFDQNLEEAKRLAGLFAAIADFPKPVIARVHGNVLGGGVGLVCACDIVVSSDDARFGLTEVRLGILPAIISPYVIRRLGDTGARELMLTGERFDAATAHRYGIVNHVVTAAELDAKVAERVGELLKGAPHAQSRVKELLVRFTDVGFEEYRRSVPDTLAHVRGGEEAKDGLAAFFEKRKPRWAE